MPNALLVTRCTIFAVVVASFPIGALLVFGHGYGRRAVANAISIVYSVGLLAAMFASFFPFSCVRRWRVQQRVRSLVLVYLGMSYVTHLTWELGWLVAHNAIAAAQDQPWAYLWWAYIDGGDMRYARADTLLLCMELLSVTNGAIGMTALVAFMRTPRAPPRWTGLVFVGTAVVHLYSALLYYLSEVVAGLPNVDTACFVSTYFKFGLANSPWVIVPWFVFWWVHREFESPAKRA